MLDARRGRARRDDGHLVSVSVRGRGRDRGRGRARARGTGRVSDLGGGDVCQEGAEQLPDEVDDPQRPRGVPGPGAGAG